MEPLARVSGGPVETFRNGGGTGVLGTEVGRDLCLGGLAFSCTMASISGVLIGLVAVTACGGLAGIAFRVHGLFVPLLGDCGGLAGFAFAFDVKIASGLCGLDDSDPQRLGVGAGDVGDPTLAGGVGDACVAGVSVFAAPSAEAVAAAFAISARIKPSFHRISAGVMGRASFKQP